MKTKRSRRVLSCALATAMLSTMALGVMPAVNAADSLPMTGDQARKANQPKFSGYRVMDIRDWTPETDPGSEFLQAQVPLQDRNEAFRGTQANPGLNSEGEVMLMQGDYGNAFVDGMMYNNTFGYHTLNFWQYVDYYSPWHGAATATTPEDLHDWNYENTASNGWERRYFEFGVMNIPNPAYTNAAHKNGVKSIACIYFDQYYRQGQTINELFQQDEDGKFPVAEKLIEMAEYFGYDGYFFNAEEPVNSEFSVAKKKFLARLKEAGLYTQYYNTNSYMDASKATWLKDNIDGVPTEIQDSVFVNYGWPGTLDGTSYNPNINFPYIEANGIDPFKQVFYGVENNQGKFSGSHPSAANIEQLYTQPDGSKNLRASVALFTPSDYYQRDLDGSKLQNPDYQWMIAERERMFFSGVKSDPTHTGDQPGYSRPEVGVSNASNWPGVADFVSERSVIRGSAFQTNFNVGKGLQYFTDGQVSSDEEWSNINIQDILPTWQWWIDTDGTKLNVDFDYGTKYNRLHNNGSDYGVPFTKIGGYNGGNSLVVNGTLDSENILHLFKTDMSVKDSTKVSITYNKSSVDDSSKMELGVIFKNAPDTVVTFNVPYSGKQTDGWVTKSINLGGAAEGEYVGEDIAALCLVFDGGKKVIDNYQMNIGEIKVSDDQNYTPETPENFRISRAFTDDEMIVEWDLGDPDVVDQYEIYANLSDGQRIFVGGIFDDVYYIKSLLNEKDVVTLELVAIGKDGSRSEPATISYNYKQAVSDLSVEVEDRKVIVRPEAVVQGTVTKAVEAGSLNVSWSNPTVDYESLEITVSMDDSADDSTYTTTVGKGVNSAQVIVPRGHGEAFDVSVATVFADGTKSAPMHVTGYMNDSYIESFKVTEYNVRPSNTSLTLWCPDPNDWFKMHVTINGQKLKFNNQFSSFGGAVDNAIRAATKMTTTMPASTGIMEIVLEDYSGNFSEPTYVPYGTYSFDSKLDSSMIPDEALLNAIKEQVGDSLVDAINYRGNLDLSGTAVKDLTGLNLLANISSLDLSNCTELTEIPAGIASNMKALSKINVTGCTGLTSINLANSSVEKLVYDNLDNLNAIDISGARFDLTAGTAIRNLVDAVAANGTASYDGQRPVLYPSIADIVTDKNNRGEPIDLNEYFANAKANPVSVSGTSLEDLKDAGFVAEGYDWDSALNVKNIAQIRITDAQGNVSYNGVVNTTEDGVYTVEYITYNSSAVEGEAAYTQKVNVRAVTTVLESVIAHAEELLANGALENTMEAVVTEFHAALNSAKEIVANNDSTQQEINDATERLLAVIAKVDWKQGDKTALQVAIDIANTIKPNLDLYVEQGKQEFLDALAEAEALMANGNAWDDEIKASTTRLTIAMTELRMAANKDILNDMINQANSIDLSQYTDDSANAVRNALAKAEALAAQDTSDQGAVDAAAQSLKTALAGLTYKNAGNTTNGNNGSANNNNGTITRPVGDGSTPTKTGDGFNAAGIAFLTLASAAGALLMMKKKN